MSNTQARQSTQARHTVRVGLFAAASLLTVASMSATAQTARPYSPALPVSPVFGAQGPQSAQNFAPPTGLAAWSPAFSVYSEDLAAIAPAISAEGKVMAALAPALAAEGKAMAAGGPALLQDPGAMADLNSAMAFEGSLMASLQPGMGGMLFAAQASSGNSSSSGSGGALPASDRNLKDDLFTGTERFAKNATQATEVNMSPDDLEEVRGSHAMRAHATLLNSVHSYEFDKPGQYNIADVDEFRRKLEGPDWHCSVHTRDLKTGGSTDVCSKHRADGLKESAIITVEPKELTFIHRIERVRSSDHDGHDSD